jgi:hypothetical protein
MTQATTTLTRAGVNLVKLHFFDFIIALA